MDPLDRFKSVYYEECADLLRVAEEGLAAMLDERHDQEVINEIFRAVHSIKGGAGSFGFDALVNFTHSFETLMSFVRDGRLTPPPVLLNDLLRSIAVLEEFLACAQNGQEPPPDLGAELLERMNVFIVPEEGVKPAAFPAEGRHKSADEMQLYAIRFKPPADILDSGNEPLYIIRALKELGELKTECDFSALPALSDFIPDRFYLGWTFRLTTDRPLAEIREVFEFVEFDSELDIQMQDPQQPAAADAGAEKDGQEHKNAGKSQKGIASQTIRVDMERIDTMVNLVGEMVITQAMLLEQFTHLHGVQNPELLKGVAELSGQTRLLQESVMQIRAQPIKQVFSRMPRIVRELAFHLGKEAEVWMEGEETEVDLTVVEKLVDPLTHMIRNAVDHGIECPETREKAGKPRSGIITLSACCRSGRIIIEVIDDGGGINREKVLSKAIAQKLIAPDAKLTDTEIDNLIFLPGFSTKDEISSISGRGVGMDVVKQNVNNIGGRVSVLSAPGKGSRIAMSLPLTLAVMDAMIVSVGRERFVIPITNIVESARPKKEQLSSAMNQWDMFFARGEYVRLLHLHEVFGISGAEKDPTKGLVVLVENDEGRRLSIQVDDILGQQQVVIKSIETNYKRMQGIAAATILGDGRVAMILDIPELYQLQAIHSSVYDNPDTGERRGLVKQ